MSSSSTERDQLAILVKQWNENRVELFRLSYPTEDLEIEGVMRFYFQDGGERVLTKCVRVSSTATTRAVVEALTDKFLPDLKMLTDDHYSLWEVHENGTERKLEDEEKPLLVQLTWHRDDKEGRFLLRRDRQSIIPLSTIQLKEEDNIKRGLKRFSKREKREQKKKHQKDIVTVNSGREGAAPITDLYRQVPPNTFTRTISNPEVVMKKRREKKLEAKLKEMGHGGSLKIYGGELVPSRPYVTILVSMKDRADRILSEALEKYGLDYCSPDDFVLVEMSTFTDQRHSLSDLSDIEGRIIDPDEVPLMEMASRCGNESDTYFAIKKKPSNYRATSTVRGSSILSEATTTSLMAVDPTLLILGPNGMPILPLQGLHIRPGVTEIGSDRALPKFSAQNICLEGNEIRGRHCVITYMDRVVTITPSASDAIIEVNNRRIAQTEILNDGNTVRIGNINIFRFVHNQQTHNEMKLHTDYSQMTQSMYATSLSGSSLCSRQTNEQVDQKMGDSSTFVPNGLPISLQIGDYKVWDYLVEVMSRGWSDFGSFRLSPAYSLYLALRFFHSHSKPYLVQFFTRIAHHMNQIAQECSSRDELLFWLANGSELYYLVEKDHELRTSPRSGHLGSVVECIFRRLCIVLLGSLRPACYPLMEIYHDNDDGSVEIISILDSTLRAARASRLNAALTIQLCSHMFHDINITIFNCLVGISVPVQLTTQLGKCLQVRLTTIYRWAEQMGVELAAECHLDRCRQAANLLAAQKNDVAALGATCYKLNSLQVRYLLSHFVLQDGEIPCDNDVMARVFGLAERQADELTIEDGLALSLGETEELSLPFLLPQDGYTAEQLHGAPDGLMQYLLSLQEKGLCHSVYLHESGSGWQHLVSVGSLNQCHMNASQQIPPSTTVPITLTRSASQSTLTSVPTTQFGDSFGSNNDDITHVVLKRGSGGIGLSIVAAQGVGDRQIGIYVKKVVDGRPAALDGRLSAGDQLLSVNGHSLLGISQEEAAEFMSRSGTEVHFEVRKGAALRNGLSTWLCQQAPMSISSCGTATIIPPSPSSQSQQNKIPNSRIGVSSNYAPISKYGSQQSMQTPNYQRNQTNSARPQTFFEVNQYGRSISASEVYQNDPNISFSQRSLASTAGSGFDRLPAHYRQSNRPIVYQPSRQSCVSPSALRKSAQSPVSLYRPPSTSGIYKPPSVTNLFAPPRSPNPLQGYVSTATRESNQDLFRASLPISPPTAHSSPREEYRNLPLNSTAISNLGCQQPSPSPPKNPTARSCALSSRLGINTNIPRATVGPSFQNGCCGGSGYGVLNTLPRNQESAVVHPMKHETDIENNRRDVTKREDERATTTFGVRGSLPTTFNEYRSCEQSSSYEGGQKNLEKTNTSLISRDVMNNELDRLDAKESDMSNEEMRRYRELLHVEGNRCISGADPFVKNRTETLIDDVDTSPERSAISTENISPDENKRVDKKSTQFEVQNNIKGSEDLFESPGIVGAQEVYRDPRQRRLNELQERQMLALKSSDGVQLGFRDKMKMFANQLGESSPKQRISASSAERQIENDN